MPILLFLVLISSDPFSFFHPFGFKMYGMNMRMHAASAIKSGNYDSYILGTSMLENTSARNLEKVFPGSHFANISISGGNYFERAIILNFLLKNPGTKRVFFSLDGVYLTQPTERSDYPSKNFTFLYNTNPVDDIAVYFNLTNLKQIARYLLKEHGKKETSDKYFGFNRPNAWMYVEEHMCRFGGLNRWLAAKNNNQIISAFAQITSTASKIASGDVKKLPPDEEEQAIRDAIAYCEKYVINHVRENPSVMFYLVFPPYSRIQYATWHQYAVSNAHTHEAAVRYFAKMAGELDNLFVYGFEDQDFLDQIELYKDTSHYHPDINQRINMCIKNGECMLTPENIEQYLDKARKAALSFDLVGLGGKIQKYLDERSSSDSQK